MTAVTSTRLLHDDGADFFFEQEDEPIAVVGSGFTVTKFEVRGGISLQTFALTVDDFVPSQYIMAIQYGPDPYTPVPVNLDTAVDSNLFVFAETIPSNANSPSWSNEADTGGYMMQLNVDRTDYRQILVPDGISYQFYFSVGPNIDGSLLLGFRRFVSVRMWLE